MTELPPGNRRMSRAEWCLFGFFALVVVYYAVITEYRSCFLGRPMTDFQVYLRAAWAARTGHDMYAITDDNNWHYCYPPTFALLLMPFADPPGGWPRDGYFPFYVSVALWIVASYAFIFWTVHVLARLILPDAERGTRRWWSARNAPLMLSSGGIGYNIVHGQVNTLIAACIAAMFLAWVARRQLASGMWLAGALAVKVVPAFLILFPLLHRDRRMVAGVALGGVLLLGVLPACVFGVPGAVRENLKLVDQVLVPGTTGQGDQTRAKELTATVATDSHSFQAVLHNYHYPDRDVRPPEANTLIRVTHWMICSAMIALTMWVGWRSRNEGVPEQLMFLGCMLLVMVLVSPVSHTHHYAMTLPGICGFWLKGLKDRPGHAWPSREISVPMLMWFVGTSLHLLPGRTFEQMREFGMGTLVTVILWGTGLRVLARGWQQAAPRIAGRIGPADDQVAVDRAIPA
jgi:hypothetical protein